ncbi:MAG: MBG domain-containing protein [bacterium]|nr:MBG domain-containing protein [bacterium]
MENRIKYFKAFAVLFTCALLFCIGNVDARTVTVATTTEFTRAVSEMDKSITEVKLGADINLTDYTTIYISGRDFTVDLAGKTLNAGTNSLTILYGGMNTSYLEGNMTFKDSSPLGTGKVMTERSLYFITSNTSHKDEIKHYGITIDGGTYVQNYDASYSHMFGFFDNAYYTNENNITVDVNIKKANVELNHTGQCAIDVLTAKESDMKMNYSIESMTVKGNGVYVARYGALSTFPIKSVVSNSTKVFYNNTDGTESMITDMDKTIGSLVTSGENGYIKFKKSDDLKISNVEFESKYSDRVDAKEISITNTGDNDLQIKDVTVNDTNAFEIISGSKTTLSSGEVDKTWKVKPKDGIEAGEYTSEIIVTDTSDIEYEAVVKIKVSPKELTDFEIDINDWTYKEEADTPYVVAQNNLDGNDYVIEYKKIGSTSWSSNIPKTAGVYTVRVRCINDNYIVKSASKDFEIKKIDKKIEIVSNSNSWVYDGNTHTDSGYKIYYDGVEITSGILPTGDLISANVTGSVIDVVDTSNNNNTIESVNLENADCYSNVVKTSGKLEITPIPTPIVITVKNASKDYDGTKLVSAESDSNISDVLVSGDIFRYRTTGDITYVGTISNTVGTVKVTRGDKDITANYTFGKHIAGKLTINPAKQPLKSKDLYVGYGETLETNDLKSSVSGNLGTLDIIMPTESNTCGTFDENGFTAGSTTCDLALKVTAGSYDVNGDGVADYKETEGTINIHVIEKEEVTISGLTNNQKFTYDGTRKKPEGTITISNENVSTSDLDILYTGKNYSSTNPPINAGIYTVTYSIKNSNSNYTGSVSYTFTIEKSKQEKPTLDKDTFVYNGYNQGVTPIYDENIFKITGDSIATNVGNYSITWSLKDKDNYEWTDGTNLDITLNWSITKATPKYTVPTGLKGVKGQKVSDISLPEGFTFNDPNSLLLPGVHNYKATYTPSDTNNYKIIDDIDITITAKNTFLVTGIVNGDGGTITVPSKSIIDGDKAEIIFTPNSGYMIDKVLVNGEEVQVTDNKLTLTMDSDKNVIVSYKKVPFKIVVKDVKGAFITPNGIVTVYYGDNKEFTIDVKPGYKLVKVLVNNIDRTSSIKNGKLKLTNITSNMCLTVLVEKASYKVILGANQKYIITKNNKAIFKINADYEKFSNGGKVYVDGVLLKKENYTSKSGSTIITLNKKYMDSLSIGKHTLKVVFNDGSAAETTFTVMDKDSVKNPKTMDNIMFHITIGALSIIGLAGLGYFYRKEQVN